MADSSTFEDDLGVSPFPHPPKIFYKLYTDENVKEGKCPLPPKPIKGIYRMFGAQFNTNDAMIRKLHEQDIKQLYPNSHDRKAELRKLNRSIIVCFLELLDILILNPASPARSQKITDLSFLFINIHHIINEFRPHQARETLKVIMERQKKQREDITTQLTSSSPQIVMESLSNLNRDVDEVHSILKECGELMVQASGTVSTSLQIASSGSESDVASGGITSDHDKSETSGPKVKKLYMEDFVGLVERQDTELCAAIDSFLLTT